MSLTVAHKIRDFRVHSRSRRYSHERFRSRADATAGICSSSTEDDIRYTRPNKVECWPREPPRGLRNGASVPLYLGCLEGNEQHFVQSIPQLC